MGQCPPLIDILDMTGTLREDVDLTADARFDASPLHRFIELNRTE